MDKKAKSPKTYTIGVDIGGTKMRAVLFDGEKVVADYLLATPSDDLEHLLIMLKALVEPLLDRAKTDKVKVAGIGLGVPSVLDAAAETVLAATNLGIINKVRLAKKFADFTGLPAVMDNDAYCFIRAEAAIGAARGCDNAFGVTLGTGIGGGWWHGGAVYRGAHGGAAQVWRTILDVKQGVWFEEAYHRLTQNNPGRLSQKAILGDPLAEKAYAELGDILGIGLANIANTIDPEIFVLGGGVMQSSDLFLSRLKKAMKNNIDSAEAARKIKVLKSKLGENAGAIGAALLAG